MKRNDDQMILVTGGAGFIGSCIVRHLNEQNLQNIIIVDDLGKNEKWKNLVGKQYKDLISKHHLFDWLKGRESLIGAIIHLGACSSTVEQDAGYLVENNYRYSVRLAEYALTHGHRFIYASSAATYGDGSEGFSDGSRGLEQLHPLNMYGYSKHMFDLWAKNLGLLNQIVGLKYFNVFGPNEYHKGRMASAILPFVSSVQKDGVIKLFKSSDPDQFPDGEQKRDFIYVKDAARMTCAFLENKMGGIFNIGTGKPNSWNLMAKSVFKALNKPEHIEYIPMPTDLMGKYQNYTAADMKCTWAALNEVANCVSFEDAVIEYVKDYIVPKRNY